MGVKIKYRMIIMLKLTFPTRFWPTLQGLLAFLAFPVVPAGAAAYQDAVLALNPNFYYQLNETTTARGVVDSTGRATAAGTYNGDYLNGAPKVGQAGPREAFGGIPLPGMGAANVAHYSNNAGHIILGPGASYGANEMSVALFLKAGPSQGGDRIFTNNLSDPTKSFQITCGNNGLILGVDPAKTGADAERTLYLEDNSTQDKRLIDPANGWFHVVASTKGATGPERAANLKIWINGVDRTANLKPDVVGWGVETAFAKIGGRGDNAAAAQTHSGGQDEVSIWLNRSLTDKEAKSLWRAATLPAYANKVINLNPNFYFRLNETTTTQGVTDTMGNAPSGTYNGTYGVTEDGSLPMVGGPGPLEVFGGTKVPGLGGTTNVAHYSNNKGHIVLGGAGSDYGANNMTVAFFMKAGPSQGGDRIFTNNLTDPTKSLQIDCGNNGLVLAVDPAKTGLDAERTLYLPDNSTHDKTLIAAESGWFHVVASTSGTTGTARAANLKVWINGVNRTENLKPDVVGWGVQTAFAKIGGRGDDPLAAQTHSGAQDELSIWLGRVLSDKEVQELWQAAAPPTYAEQIVALNPDYYFKLDETSTQSGVRDTMGRAPNGTYNGDYVNGPPMVGGEGPLEVFGDILPVPVPGVGGPGNLAHYSNNAGHIILGGKGTDYGAGDMTVAMFLKAGPPQGGDRIFTNNLADPTRSFQIVTANDGLVLAVDPNTNGMNAERTLFMEDNSGPDRRLSNGNSGWFHVIASTKGTTGAERANNFKLWINGINRTGNLQPNVTGWGINTEFAKIGGRRDDPADTTTHSGAQDEVAIWLNRVLTDSEALSIWASALASGPPFKITNVVRNAATKNITITFETVVDAAYVVQRSSNLSAWEVVSGSLVAISGTTEFTDSSNEVLAGGKYFYRAVRTR